MGEVIKMADYLPRLRAATTKRVILDRSQPRAIPLPFDIWLALNPWTFFWPEDWGAS